MLSCSHPRLPAVLHAELTLATAAEDAAADAAIEPVLAAWAAAHSPEELGGGAGLESGLWVKYEMNAEDAIAALRPLSAAVVAADGATRGVVTAEDRIEAMQAAARAWNSNGAPATGQDALTPLMLWTMARAHVVGPPIRLASHVGFVMRFLDTSLYSAGSTEMWGAMQLEMVFRAALSDQTEWPETQWRYFRSCPGDLATDRG
jgi:hypothetical protein